jgi:polysaccharide export outer membrane protein
MTTIFQKLTLSVLLICTSYSVFSAQLPSNISPQQIEQFQKLPKAQQRSLAASMGVDLNAIESQLKKSTPSSSNEPIELEQHTPREVNVGPIAERVKEKNKNLQAFGYDVFANAPSSFAPINDVAIPASYVIGTGDVLNIKVFGKENDEFETSISREGKVVLPKLGQYSIAGMTFLEVKSYLRNEIKNKIIGVEVVVTLSELRSIRVFVLGEAYKPGNYLLNSLSTVTHAIFTAGGISEIGSLRNIQVKRAGKLVKKIDLYNLLLNGDSSNDIMLQSGDVVFIEPLGGTVTVKGQVKRPAIYEIKANETIGDILFMAVGLLPSAYPSSSIIERYNNENLRSIVNIDLTNALTKRQKVKAGDILRIQKSSEIFQQSITVKGAVTRPGEYQWKNNQTISDLLPNIQSHLLEDADLTYSLIVRRVGLGKNIEVLQFSLQNVISNTNSDENFVLKPHDEIIIFSYKSARTALLRSVTQKLKHQARTNQYIQLVEIAGAVKFPGTYPLPVGGDVKGLIVASGGLAESAFVANAELSRNDLSANESSVQIIPINLKNVLNKGIDNVILKSRDRLNVNTIPYWQEEQVVTLSGEFKFPGKYIVRRGETISQLIERAGGFTKYADLNASLFTREGLKDLESKNIENVIEQLRREVATKTLTDQNSSIDYEQINQLLNDLNKIEPVGRLVIDLPNLMLGSGNDITMVHGDSFFVANQNNTVNVIGQVHIAGSHLYNNHLTYKDYIKLTGGVKIQADEDRIYIIKANGAVQIPEKENWFAASNNDIKPGDTIVVPLDTYFVQDITLWQTATQIIFQSAVALAAITRV